jgi:hypothetical protein
MEMLQRATVQYYHIGANKEKQLRSFDFDYIPVPPLPSGNSGESIFRTAFSECRDETLRSILNDLYRWLVFSNFAKFGGNRKKGDRERTLLEMDAAYPYRGSLREAESFSASSHPFGDTQGAVLYLLMHSQNPMAVNYILGGILKSVLDHAHFKKYGVPTIEVSKPPTKGIEPHIPAPLTADDTVSIEVCGGDYPDSETRQKVEVAAIEFMMAWLTSRGYVVQDRQRDNCGYDLLATSAQQNLKVEVKGTDASAPRFFITRNEWRSRVDAEWRLALVTSARSTPTLTLLTGEEVERQFSFEALAWECKPRTS